MTWNIGSLYDNYNDKEKDLLSVVGEISPDVLCLQEFPENEELKKKICRIGSFKDFFYLFLSESHVGPPHRMGLIVFSKGNLKCKDTIWLNKPCIDVFFEKKREEFHPKAFVLLECRLGHDTYCVLTWHGFPFHRYGLDNRKDLFEEVYLPLNDCVVRNENIAIIAGDFNSPNAEKHCSQIQLRYRDLFSNQPTRPSGRKTDAIFVQKGVSAREKGIVDGIKTFDHYALWAEL